MLFRSYVCQIYASKYTDTDAQCVFRTRQSREPEVCLITVAYCMDWKCEACCAGQMEMFKMIVAKRDWLFGVLELLKRNDWG